MIKELAQGIEGIVSIAINAPSQAIRTLSQIPSSDRDAVINSIKSRIPIGDASYKESSLSKALPFIATGIAGIVIYNIFFRKN